MVTKLKHFKSLQKVEKVFEISKVLEVFTTAYEEAK
jgi:hypothetical protein